MNALMLSPNREIIEVSDDEQDTDEEEVTFPREGPTPVRVSGAFVVLLLEDSS